MLTSTRGIGKLAAHSRAIMGQKDMVIREARRAYLTAMSVEWSSLAPGAEEISYSDAVQQGLTAGQTFCGWYYGCQNSEACLLLAPAMLHDGDPGRGCANCACAIGRDKGDSGTQGQGRAEQATGHGPIWRKGIGRDKLVIVVRGRGRGRLVPSRERGDVMGCDAMR